MRILYDSKLPQYKTPFGTLTPEQVCTLNVHIPASVRTTRVVCLLTWDDGATVAQEISLTLKEHKGPYEIWSGEFTIPVGVRKIGAQAFVLLLLPHLQPRRQLPAVQAGG